MTLVSEAITLKFKIAAALLLLVRLVSAEAFHVGGVTKPPCPMMVELLCKDAP